MSEIKTYRENRLLFVDEEFDTLVRVECVSKHTAYKFYFLNKDGSQAKMCGNALMQFAIDYFAENNHDAIYLRGDFEDLLARKYYGDNERIAVSMPKIDYEKSHKTDVFDAEIGNFHRLHFGKNIDLRGRFPHELPEFNQSTVEILNDTTIFVDTCERGVGKTESCGSAACYAAWVYCKEYLKKDAVILVKQTGGDIYIDCTGGTPVMIQEL